MFLEKSPPSDPVPRAKSVPAMSAPFGEPPAPARQRRRGAHLLTIAKGDCEIPLQEQLYRQIRDLILSGQFVQSAKIPSSRAIAQSLKISRNIVLAALERLQADGWIATRRGSGAIVAYNGPVTQSGLLPGHIRRNARAFSIDHSPADLFPLKRWMQLQSRCWRQIRHVELQDAPPAGWEDLRNAIARMLAARRGLACSADQIFITTNTRAALDLAVRALDLHNAAMWVEDPGYFGSTQLLRHSGVEAVAVPVDDEGLQVDVGQLRAPYARAVLATSSCHFPTCVPLSAARRKALYAWADAASAWILEDDYSWYSHWEGQAPSPMAAENPRTILVSSFNEMLFSGLRVAFLVAPRHLVDRFAALRSGLEGQSNGPNQIVLAEFLNRGRLDEHLRNLREAFAKRRSALAAAIADQLPAFGLCRQSAGQHLVVELSRMTAHECVELASRAQVELRAMDRYSIAARHRRKLILGFTAFTPDALRAGVSRLASALKP